MANRQNNSRYDDFLDALNASRLGVASTYPSSANTVVSTDYIFDASQQVLTVNDNDFIRLMLVVNLTDGIVIYNPISPTLGGTTIGGDTVLTYDTTSMSDTDGLLVLYEAMSVPREEDIFEQILAELKNQTRLLEKIYS
jgi:hypothetical protein